MSRSVLFDTETTGLDPAQGDRVIEVAVLELIITPNTSGGAARASLKSMRLS